MPALAGLLASEAALAPYLNVTRSNVRLAGTEMHLDANTASILGMVLHELATNAAKYGSLSVPAGSVEVAWSRIEGAAGEPRLRLTWTERDGPQVDQDALPGFGTGFITRSLEYELQGDARLELAPQGLRCAIEFPLKGNLEKSATEPGDA